MSCCWYGVTEALPALVPASTECRFAYSPDPSVHPRWVHHQHLDGEQIQKQRDPTAEIFHSVLPCSCRHYGDPLSFFRVWWHVSKWFQFTKAFHLNNALLTSHGPLTWIVHGTLGLTKFIQDLGEVSTLRCPQGSEGVEGQDVVTKRGQIHASDVSIGLGKQWEMLHENMDLIIKFGCFIFSFKFSH